MNNNNRKPDNHTQYILNFYFYKMLHGLQAAKVTLLGKPQVHFYDKNFLIF